MHSPSIDTTRCFRGKKKRVWKGRARRKAICPLTTPVCKVFFTNYLSPLDNVCKHSLKPTPCLPCLLHLCIFVCTRLADFVIEYFTGNTFSASPNRVLFITLLFCSRLYARAAFFRPRVGRINNNIVWSYATSQSFDILLIWIIVALTSRADSKGF
jgi:hypothetical protein